MKALSTINNNCSDLNFNGYRWPAKAQLRFAASSHPSPILCRSIEVRNIHIHIRECTYTTAFCIVICFMFVRFDNLYLLPGENCVGNVWGRGDEFLWVFPAIVWGVFV